MYGARVVVVMATYAFPQSVIWGTATSSYQIEGGAREGGRGPSIWDTFSHTPGNVAGGHTGDVACDHYHRWREDIQHMAALGVRSYRFSVAWPRILPEGTGPVNQEGLDFYDRLVDGLLEAGIQPAVTLYHWDLPYRLQTIGGWANRAVVDAFVHYAEHVMKRLGDRVHAWITHNEPWCASFLSYQLGHHAPGMKDMAIALQVAHHLLLSHGRVVQLFRSLGLPGEIGITLNLSPAYPASAVEEDRAAARRQDGYLNRWFLDPVFKGRYPDDMWGLYAAAYPMPDVRSGDLETIAQPIDFLGVNYYSVSRVAHDPQNPTGWRHVKPIGPVTDMGWEVWPDGLLDLLLRLKADYGDPAIYITENGCAYPDQPDAEGKVHDPLRIRYYEQHLIKCSEAIAQGGRLKGYYAWSLMDNFEWAFGYTKRFGLIYVDFDSQARNWKDSAHWYRQVVTANAVTVEG